MSQISFLFHDLRTADVVTCSWVGTSAGRVGQDAQEGIAVVEVGMAQDTLEVGTAQGTLEL